MWQNLGTNSTPQSLARTHRSVSVNLSFMIASEFDRRRYRNAVIQNTNASEVIDRLFRGALSKQLVSLASYTVARQRTVAGVLRQ